MELTNGIGADIVIELVGFPAAVEEGVQMLRMRGTYREVGHISPNSIARLDVQKLVANQVRFFAIQHYDPWIIPNAIEFLMRTRDKYPLTKGGLAPVPAGAHRRGVQDGGVARPRIRQ